MDKLWVRISFPITDLLMLLSSLVCGAIIANTFSPYWENLTLMGFAWPNLPDRLKIFGPLVLLLLLYFHASGHYKRISPWWMQVKQVLIAACIMFLVDGFISYVTKNQFSRIWLAGTWLSAFPLVLMGRLLVRRIFIKMGVWEIETVVVGDGQNLYEVLYALKSDRFLHYNIRAIVLTGEKINWDKAPKQLANVKVVAADKLLSVVPKKSQALVVFCLNQRDEAKMSGYLKQLENHAKVQLSFVPPTSGLSFYNMSPMPFFGHDVVLFQRENTVQKPLNRMFKRIFDVVVAVMGIIALSPVLLGLMLLLKREGGNIFFGHVRIGKNGVPFKCWKFRSMVPNAQKVLESYLKENPAAKKEWDAEFKLKNDPRITKLGHILRKYSLDELPQLWNVVVGNMSIVGPRPIVKEETAFYGDKIKDYQSVKPGITGLWQVSGRNDVSYDFRVHLDSWYVENWSLWHDVVIILKTVRTVLSREGAY